MKTTKITSKEIVDGIDSRKYRRGELAKEVLLMIGAGIAIPAVLLMPNIPIVLKPLVKLLTKRCGGPDPRNFVKSLHYLHRKRLVSIAEREGQQILTVSEDGRKRVLQFNVDQMAVKRPRQMSRIMLYDPFRRGQDHLI